MHSENIFSFFVRLLEVWENGKRKGKIMYLYPHFSATRAQGKKKDNGRILALQVLFLNLGQLDFRRLSLFNDTTLHANFDMVWDKNCVELMRLSHKIVCRFRNIWDKRTEKQPNISLSLDFVHKPPFSNKPPLY